MPEITIRVIKEFDVVQFQVSKEVQDEVDAKVAAGLCTGCNKPHHGKKTCGQCTTCYPATLRAIAKKKTTRKKLIQAGKLLDKGKPGRKCANDYTASVLGRS